MAINCTPSAVVAAAACFQCISRDMQEPTELYLLAQIAISLNPALPTTPQGIAKAAASFRSITRDMREPVKEFLLCQIAAASGA